MINIHSGNPSSYFPLKIKRSHETQSVVPIQFPSTRNVLWGSKPVGEFEALGLLLPSQAVQLFVVEKSLRLAQRYSEGQRSTSFLLGSVYAKTDEGGICFGVDRFDPGREITENIGDNISKSKVPTAVVPGDYIIPIKIINELSSSSADSVSHTKEEFARSLQIMEAKICGKDPLTLSHVLSLKANLYCCKNDDELVVRLHCGAIVPEAKFKMQPIAPLPIIPTALARNLAGPLRLSDVEGTPKMGYVTMDQTRKLLLLLESDPKVYNLPLIGIWISGVHSVHHPYVWASCLRYLNCAGIKDRVLHSAGSFLLLHYSIVQKLPDVWECSLENSDKLSFELLSCQEDLHLDMNECLSKDPLCFHLTPAPDGINRTFFDEAVNEWKNKKYSSSKVEVNSSGTLNDPQPKASDVADEKPRPSPSPRPSPTQGKVLFPPVPEESLSLSFDEVPHDFDQDCPEEFKNDRLTLGLRVSALSKQSTKPRPDNANARQHSSKLPYDNMIAKQHFTKLPPNTSSNILKPSRQPFAQIHSPNSDHPRNAQPDRGKSKQAPLKGCIPVKTFDKENTPLTSRTAGHLRSKNRPLGNSALLSERSDGVLPMKSDRPQYDYPRKSSDGKRNASPSFVKADARLNNHSVRGLHTKDNPGYKNGTRNSISPVITKSDQTEIHNFTSLNNAHLNYARMSTNGKKNDASFVPETTEPLLNCPLNNPSRRCSFASGNLVSNASPIIDTSADDVFVKTADDHLDDDLQMMEDKQQQQHSRLVKSMQPKDERVVNQFIDTEERKGLADTEEQEEHLKDANDLNNSKLEEQLKKQEEMIRVLQEQVRSLLRMKETLSSPDNDPHLPLTPASTPDSNNSRFSERRAEKQEPREAFSNTDGAVKDVGPGESKPECVAVGVNTGASLLWSTPEERNSSRTECCDCNRSSGHETEPVGPDDDDAKPENETNGSLTGEKSESLVNISEDAIHVDSGQNSTVTMNNVDIPSLSLGESSGDVSKHSTLSSSVDSSPNIAEPVKGREFYDKLLFQVKDLLNKHVSNTCEGKSCQQKSTETVDVRNRNNSTSSTVQVPTREVVVKATLKELAKIKQHDEERRCPSSRVQAESSNVFPRHERSMSTSFLPDHPRMNYVSISVDETFDELAFVDEVALKYLSDEQLREFKSEVRPTSASVKRSFSRTVRFGSLPSETERRSPLRRDLRGVREVDFTWNNLSFCTKNYLTKYNLVERHISFTAHDENEREKPESVVAYHNDSKESLDDPCKPPCPSPVRKPPDDTNEILDIRRLKNLPKLF